MTHLRRTWWQLLATLVAFTLIATACGSGTNGSDAATDTTAPPRGIQGGNGEDEGDDTGEGPVYGGRIIVALEAETTNWLPGTGQFVVPSGTSIAHAIYDPLVILDHESQPQPYLAESLTPNSSITEWTLKLRSGVKFHDGSDLDAEVIKWNFDTLHNVPTSNTYGTITGAGVQEVEVVDRLTVRYKLSEPNAAFPDILRGSIGWPTSRQAYEELGADALADNPVGTGPFVFSSWTRDDRLIVERNPNYWRTDDDGNQLPYLDGIDFRPIADEDSRYQSLAADSVQVMVTLRGSTAKQVLNLVEDRDYRANVFVGNTSGASIFNVLEPPVDDIRVRSALILMSDGEDIARILGDDGLVPATDGFFAPESGWYSEAAGRAYLVRDGIDPERAEELIEEYKNDPNRSDGRGVGEPVQVEYACPPDPSLIEIGQYYQNQWGRIGVDVSLRQVEQATLVQNAIGSADSNPPWRGEFMINCWRAGAGEGDPLTSLRSFFNDPSTNPLNFTNFSHPEIDEALDALKVNADFQVRYEAAETINRIANENAIMTWSIATPSLVGWRADIVGLTSWVLPDGTLGNGTPSGHMHFSQTYLRR
jgi:peptide/nickel transport system substrate-binding protein